MGQHVPQHSLLCFDQSFSFFFMILSSSTSSSLSLFIKEEHDDNMSSTSISPTVSCCISYCSGCSFFGCCCCSGFCDYCLAPCFWSSHSFCREQGATTICPLFTNFSHSPEFLGIWLHLSGLTPSSNVVGCWIDSTGFLPGQFIVVASRAEGQQ